MINSKRILPFHHLRQKENVVAENKSSHFRNKIGNKKIAKICAKRAVALDPNKVKKKSKILPMAPSNYR